MSLIDADFVLALARTWHRFEPPEGQERGLETLAGMLAPMDDAGEALAARMHFDLEPSDFLLGLDATAAEDPEP